jgi:hypothetical protein
MEATMFLRKLLARRLEVPEPPAVDHSLASAAIDHAIEAHQAAQAQATQAQRIVSELKRVNIRNGFAPAIEASVIRKLGGAS